MNNVSRRDVLTTAGALGFVAATGASGKWLSDRSRWTLVSIPDTQKYAESSSLIGYARAQTKWIADNAGAENIAFVTHEGDLVEHGGDVTEWERMGGVMSTLDGVVPYSTLLGNHDYAVEGDRSSSIENYRTYFGRSRYDGYGWFGGAGPDDRGYYQRFSAGGYDFLHLALEWGVPGNTTDASTVMGWAQGVLDANPNTPTIVTTHAYLWNTGHSTRAYGANSGETIFEELVSPNAQVFMVLNGHFVRVDEWAQVSQNDAGLDVYEMFANYEANPNGGNGWLRLIEFVPKSGFETRDQIRVRTYSPSLDEFRTGSRSRFAFDLSFDDRFDNTRTGKPR